MIERSVLSDLVGGSEGLQEDKYGIKAELARNRSKTARR